MKASSSEKAKNFLRLFTRHNSRALIRNLDVAMSEIVIGGLSFPMSQNYETQNNNCYICRPSAAYIDYAIEETRNFAKIPLLRKILTNLIRCCAALARATGLDEQVQFNNWLFSTNPVPHLITSTIADLKKQLTKTHPNSAVIIRSLNEMADASSMKQLQEAGFKLLASRQIYMFSGLSDDGNHRRTINRDRRMREKNGYQLVAHRDFTDDDFLRCETLYNMLYLEKYSGLKPHYTGNFFREMHSSKLVEFAGARNANGILDAFSGVFEANNTITQPFVGYDTTLPQEFGLYRIAMSFGIEYAVKHKRLFNMSSGAASFKRNRGAKPSLEYIAVYNRHLSFKNRVTTVIIQKILKYVGIPLIRRFEL